MDSADTASSVEEITVTAERLGLLGTASTASALPSRWSASLGIFNLLNTRAAAAEFWYVDRLQNEIGT